MLLLARCFQCPNLQVIARKARLMGIQMSTLILHYNVEAPHNYLFIQNLSISVQNCSD